MLAKEERKFYDTYLEGRARETMQIINQKSEAH